MSETKKCTKCGEVKAFIEFSPNKAGKFGVSTRCKKCLSNCASNRRIADIDKFLARERNYRSKNSEFCIARTAMWRDKNRQEANKKRALYRLEHLAIELERRRKWILENREKVNKGSKRQRANITDGYAAAKLGLPLSECPPELIELKREQLLVHRMTKQLTNLLKEQVHGTE